MCSGSSAVQCSDPNPPTESCNLLDDDCDGRIDEVSGGQSFQGCTRAVFRLYNPDLSRHFYTTSEGEADSLAQNGWNIESRSAFHVYANNAAGLSAMYRCFRGGYGHLYTTDPNCEGWGSFYREGTFGYIASSAVSGANVLYRAYFSNSRDHFYTTSLNEYQDALRQGYQGRTSPGWVFPR